MIMYIIITIIHQLSWIFPLSLNGKKNIKKFVSVIDRNVIFLMAQPSNAYHLPLALLQSL